MRKLLVILMASIVSLGMIKAHISWNPNTEPDMSYYRLQRAVGDTSEWLEFRIAHPETTYVDTLPPEWGGKRVFYRLAAVDTAGNSSAFCAPVSIVVPDVIAPEVPAGIRVKVIVEIETLP